MSEKLHDDIFATLPPDFIRRMRNWVRGRDGAPVAISVMEERVDHTRHEIPIPTLLGEAQDTERALRALPQRYMEVVSTFWLYEANTIQWMATATPRLRLWKLGKQSFKDWLAIGHERLQVQFAKQTAAEAKRRAISAAAQVR